MTTQAKTIVVGLPDRKDLELPGQLPDEVEVRRLSSDEETWNEALADVSFLIGVPWWGRDRTARAIALMPELRVIQTVTAGVDWIVPIMPEGVTVCDSRGCHDVGMAEWSIAMLLALNRGFPELRDDQRAERWHAPPLEPHARFYDTFGSTLLIVGYGSIGTAVEERLAPFGVTVTRLARTPRDGVHGIGELDGLLPLADAVLVLVPLTRETRQMVDDAFIGQMKPDAALILASRGEVTDTDALVRAVSEGRIRAGLDVVEPAPLRPDHALWTAPNVFITPHIGGRSPGLYPRLARLIEAQIARFAAGEPLVNVVENGY